MSAVTRLGGRGGDLVAEARGRPMAHAVLELIWHQQGITRADIARSTGLARSTVSDLVGDLLDSGLVIESGDAPSRGGRRAVMLTFDDDAHAVLGVDIGASHVSVVLTNLRGRVLHWVTEACEVRDAPDRTCEVVERLCRSALVSSPANDVSLLGLGVALPAPVDDKDPGRPAASVLPAWEGHAGLADVAGRLGVPLEVENDANLGALAELWWGTSEGIRNFTFLKVATGVGAGHIVDGDIFRGSSGVAGEIGHVTIDPAGPPCVCGNRGCLTTFVGTEALLDRVRALAPEYPGSPIDAETATLKGLTDAALAGDPLALAVIDEAGLHLGDAISGLINLMNPAEVVLGGGLTRVGDVLLDPIRREVARRTLVTSAARTRIRASALGERDVALGAATLVIARALEAPDRFFPQLAPA
ncbi:MAG TPA: ROK family transcriptional regulator [Longimicrobiales bacterium]|nr:ROK family transcriptional regulator [Longimicrobiales bacterium]